MKNFIATVGSVAALALPFMVSAQGIADTGGGAGGKFGDLLENILKFVDGVVIPFIIGIGFLVFVWGMFKFFIVGGSNDDAKEQGKSLMIYATLGFVLIIVFWGIVNLLAYSTGLEDGSIKDLVPKTNVSLDGTAGTSGSGTGGSGSGTGDSGTGDSGGGDYVGGA